MLFNTEQPITTFTAPKILSNNKDLGALGYNSDGSRTGWGDFLSFIPGVNLATNAIAQGDANGTDAAGKIGGYQKGNLDKLLLEGEIAGTVLGGAGLLGGGASTLGSAGADAGVISGGANALGSGTWMNFLQKAGGLIGKGSPIANLTDGADNNTYQAPTRESLIQNYNG